MLESLGCSYLRHVKNCWLVQTNWKASATWPKRESADRLEAMFQDMRARFDGDANDVLKDTKDAAQFLRQAEIDILGVDFKGDVHAVEVAFHEAGLNYTGPGGTRARVLKKMLRTYLVLQAFDGFDGDAHVSFISPKVNPAVATELDDIFGILRGTYPGSVSWNLYINDSFMAHILQPTLAATESTSDTAELFVRAARLIASASTATNGPAPGRQRTRDGSPATETEKIQPLVREIMRTLLVDRPALLDRQRLLDLQDSGYCKRIGLETGNHPLLRRKSAGKKVERYWADLYADAY